MVSRRVIWVGVCVAFFAVGLGLGVIIGWFSHPSAEKCSDQSVDSSTTTPAPSQQIDVTQLIKDLMKAGNIAQYHAYV